tara:strand:- start:16923 stop:17075 length:153 start_codon:yes stop_codon:yes gene_type:complete
MYELTTKKGEVISKITGRNTIEEAIDYFSQIKLLSKFNLLMIYEVKKVTF